MAVMPGTDWIGPTVNKYAGGMVEHRGLVLHIQGGTEAGSESWFKDPSAQASAHFLNPKSGNLRQMVDTDDAAWTEMAGNRHWVSVENEGLGGDSLTASQIENCARLLAWLHSTYSVPLASTDDPNGTGLGWHGMGGAAWGGHYDCPGDPVKAQRPQILARAAQLLGQPAPAPAPAPGSPSRTQVVIDGQTYGYGAHGPQVTAVGRALVATGFGSHYSVGPGPDWSDADTLNYQDYQRSLGYTGSAADGVPGPASLHRLLGNATPADAPFPGAGFFHAGQSSDLITRMGERLVQEGCSRYQVGPGPNWGSADQASYAAWQERLGYSGASADGIPGAASWGQLHVPA